MSGNDKFASIQPHTKLYLAVDNQQIVGCFQKLIH
jgi:hypothetical protein